MSACKQWCDVRTDLFSVEVLEESVNKCVVAH